MAVASIIRSIRMLSQPPNGGWRGIFRMKTLTANSHTNRIGDPARAEPGEDSRIHPPAPGR